MPEHGRDFAGYRGAPPAIDWPNGARLAVSIVVNVEEGAELSLGMGDEANEFIYEAVERVYGVRDLCMESHFEYGTRAGWPRLRRALSDRQVRATLNANGRALELSPWIAEEAVRDGHEVAAHGWRWERHVHMTPDVERTVIARSAAAIGKAAGAPPVGWHTRSATSPHTRELLVEHGGFLYDSNAYNDDTPYMVDVGGRAHVVLPYAFDTNDMRFLNGGGFVFADDFSRYCIAAFDRLYAEGATAPRMLSIGLHLRIIGRPARIGGLDAFLDHALSHEGVWFARRDEIAHHWRAGLGLPRWMPAGAA
ncbi:polysaccharide deacetylase family protein [Aureimonas altamirensis]|uniref:polysaccharide deacetylase family protein n=1 Tax=Aureimonas altamirensis TaxID=370622 RepID=UPI001E4BEDB9|nr:polysaccharide deacetylase family protein [Aureimonas altamirensis]UHD43797.1 polysaccharide deacetylase family protein [Aureimonas altamirensis]